MTRETKSRRRKTQVITKVNGYRERVATPRRHGVKKAKRKRHG